MKNNKIFSISILLIMLLFGASCQLWAQTSAASGIVVDTKGEAMIGVNIREVGTTNGTITDINGRFSIKVKAGAKLLFNYIGYIPRELTATASMNVVLQEDSKSLDEVVVVGYGSQKRANLSGSVSTVDVSKTLESRPITDIGRGLQGAVPSLMITSATGDIGQNPVIRLRGAQGSLNATDGTTPLILLDNVEIKSLQMVNPDDVESISVLKDAASASIYGSRAAWGVILITSKSGKQAGGKIAVSYNNTFSWRTPTTQMKLSGAPEGAELAMAMVKRTNPSTDVFGAIGYSIDQTAIDKMYEWREKYGNLNLGNEMVEGRDFEWRGGKLYFYREWDAVDMYIKKWSPQQQHNISINGGTEKLNFNLGLGLLKQSGALKANEDTFDRYSINLGVNSKVNKSVDIRGRIIMSMTDTETPFSYGGATYDPMYYLTRWPSFYPYGTLEDKPFRNAITEVNQSTMNKTGSLLIRAALGTTIKIVKGLTLDADYTFAATNTHDRNVGGYVEGWDFWAGAGYFKHGKYTAASYDYVSYASSWNAQNTFKSYLTYNLGLGGHSIKAMAGTDVEVYQNWGNTSKRMGLIAPNKGELSLATGDQYATGYRGHWATLGFFGRINYSFKDRYLLELNGRYDGSSRFPTSQQWGFFPSGSVAWRVSEEAFMEKTRDVLSNLKLRSSYGVVGNDNVGANAFVSVMASENSNWVINGLKSPTFKTPTNVSPILTWESIATLDFGVDAGFFNNSLNFTFDWYQRKTNDMLSPGETMPSSLGVAASKQNYGQITATGWEFQVDYSHRFNNGLTLNGMFTISDVVEKITKYKNDTKLISSNYEGKVLGEVWGYETDRYFTKDDFDYYGTDLQQLKPGIASQSRYEASWFKYGEGDIKYVDRDGDGAITPGENTVDNPGDQFRIGNTNRRYLYGFRLGAAWHGFDFDIFFQGVGKHSQWAQGPAVIQGWRSAEGQFEHMLDYWTPENPDAFYPRPSQTGEGSTKNFLPQTKYLLDRSYLRCKTIALGYSIPKTLLAKVGAKSLRIFANVENAFEFSNMNIPVDPETSYRVSENSTYGRSYPFMRTVSFGLQLGL